MTDDVKDTGVRTDRAKFCPQCVAIAEQHFGLLAERDAAIARAEKAEESRTAAYTRLMDADATNDYLCAMVCESHAQNEALSAQADALRAAIADDAFAATFQSFGQYRTALLAINKGADEEQSNGGPKVQAVGAEQKPKEGV